MFVVTEVSPVPWHFRLNGKALQVGSSLVVYDAVQVVLARGPENPEDVVQLIQIVFPRENRSV